MCSGKDTIVRIVDVRQGKVTKEFKDLHSGSMSFQKVA